MKKTDFIRITIGIGIILAFNSCRVDDENKGGTTIKKETISGKWNVIGSSRYESFEFNTSGNYIVIYNPSTKSAMGTEIAYGEYEINGETIELLDFGKLEEVNIDDDELEAVVTEIDIPGIENPIVAVKSGEMDNTTRTDLLCRTWKVISAPDYAGDDDSELLISRAGTYLFIHTDGTQSSLAQWQWKDENERIFCFSHTGDPTCRGTNEAEVIELTNNSCKIEEFTYPGIWVLVPASNKSATMCSEKQHFLNPESFSGR